GIRVRRSLFGLEVFLGRLSGLPRRQALLGDEPAAASGGVGQVLDVLPALVGSAELLLQVGIHLGIAAVLDTRRRGGEETAQPVANTHPISSGSDSACASLSASSSAGLAWVSGSPGKPSAPPPPASIRASLMSISSSVPAAVSPRPGDENRRLNHSEMLIAGA